MADKQAATSDPARAAAEESGSEDQEEEEKVVDMAPPPAPASHVPPPTNKSAGAAAAVGRTDSSEMLLEGVPSDCLGLASAAGYERLPRARSHDDRDPKCASPDKEKRSPKKLLGRFFDKKKGAAGDQGHGRANTHAPPPPEEKEVGEVSTAAVTATPAAGAGTAAGGAEEKKKKKRSSWLPDPERRWPIQGFY